MPESCIAGCFLIESSRSLWLDLLLVLIPLVGTALAAWLTVRHEFRRSREQEAADQLLDWVDSTGALAVDMAVAWERGPSDGGPTYEVKKAWEEAQRRARLDGRRFLRRLPSRLRAAVADDVEDLIEFTDTLLGSNYVSEIREGDYRGEAPPDVLKEGWAKMGQWVDALTERIANVLEVFASTGKRPKG